jgi:hypothetical protein
MISLSRSDDLPRNCSCILKEGFFKYNTGLGFALWVLELWRFLWSYLIAIYMMGHVITKKRVGHENWTKRNRQSFMKWWQFPDFYNEVSLRLIKIRNIWVKLKQKDDERKEMNCWLAYWVALDLSRCRVAKMEELVTCYSIMPFYDPFGP